MRNHIPILAVLLASTVVAAADWRDIRTGLEIPSENYADQPYVVITRDGNWLCTLTTGAGHEGQTRQHVAATISADKGRTWSALIDIEPADGPEASWVMPLITPSGRVYAFYNYNGDNVRTLPSGQSARADMLGWYCYRCSDDHGRTWSPRRRLPVRLTDCDRTNNWKGEVQIFWGIGKPITHGGSVWFGFTKLGKYMLDYGEGWFFRSDNILTEPDPARIQWLMLPAGEHGLRGEEFGSIQEEHNLVPLANGDLFCIYRTTTGYPVQSYSRDGGKTWSRPEFATYSPSGRRLKTPRACPRLWKAANGKYLFWFHNHSGADFNGRNPAWLCGGVEIDGVIHWSQPEILLYDADPTTRMSYPDLIEQDGRYWVTETQKTIARVHEIDPNLLEGLWGQFTRQSVTTKGLALSAGVEQLRAANPPRMPRLPDLTQSDGFTIDLCVAFESLDPNQVVLDARDAAGRGILVAVGESATVQLVLSDGKIVARLDCDRGLLSTARTHRIAFTLDAGPRIITCVVDGQLCDGGPNRQFGWMRYDPAAFSKDLNADAPLKAGPALRRLHVYTRPLTTSQTVANHKAPVPN